ncbi:MAG: hypothetical protein QG635_1288 [Bacteroidota bacterium]|nr:hypothetical protein [Bacteroidota bacterium]
MIIQDDNKIIAKILAGHSNAMAKLIDRYKRGGFALAYRICRNREDAEEILQDSFMKIYMNLDKFRFGAKFSTWLFRIVYNEAISFNRKNKTRQFEEIADNYNVTNEIKDDSKEDAFIEQDMIKYLDAALEDLEEESRALLHLYYYEEKNVNEIAEILGITPSNVKIKLFRVRKRLYSTLKRLMKNEIEEFYG